MQWLGGPYLLLLFDNLILWLVLPAVILINDACIPGSLLIFKRAVSSIWGSSTACISITPSFASVSRRRRQLVREICQILQFLIGCVRSSDEFSRQFKVHIILNGGLPIELRLGRSHERFLLDGLRDIVQNFGLAFLILGGSLWPLSRKALPRTNGSVILCTLWVICIVIRIRCKGLLHFMFVIGGSLQLRQATWILCGLFCLNLIWRCLGHRISDALARLILLDLWSVVRFLESAERWIQWNFRATCVGVCYSHVSHFCSRQLGLIIVGVSLQ